MKERLGYIDIAKGIAIILVILGHNSVPVEFKHFMFSFHMPLFFILAGYFFNQQAVLKDVIYKGWIQLVRPYLFTGLCILLFFVLFQISNNIINNVDYNLNQFKDLLCDVFTGNIGAVWFLLALFIAKIIVAIVVNSSNKNFVFSVLLIIATFGYVMGEAEVFNIFCYQQAMIASLYLYIGIMMRKYDVFSKKISVLNLIVFSIVVYASASTMFLAFAHYFPNGIFSIISSAVISYIIVCNCKLIDSLLNIRFVAIFVRILRFIGQNTLIILCFHTMEMSFNLWKYIPFLDETAIICLKIIVLCTIPLFMRYIPVFNMVFLKKR